MDIAVKIKSVNQNELLEMVRAFAPYVDINEQSPIVFDYFDYISTDKINIIIKITGKDNVDLTIPLPDDVLGNKKYSRRYGKIAIYQALRDLTGVNLPYGSLTGVRPTKLYYELMREGENPDKILAEEFNVSFNKIQHIKKIIQNQKGIINKSEKEVDVYVNIPFCPTRCAYCSFVAVSMKQLSKYLENYVYCLNKEISIIKNTILENNLFVRAVYFGGGTPTSIPVHMLKGLIENCDFSAKEFTVEAGRSDTISKEVLEVLEGEGVTRISVNPQTFHDKTLKLIGRAHTVDEFLRAFELTKNYNFIVNIDLIAALPEENLDDFKYSINKAVALSPDNITVHNLSLKRGSALTVGNYVATNYGEAEKMIDYSVETLEKRGYYPYYMYRQKYNMGNLENSGYSVRGKECIYNVDIMEENCSVLAAGAGAISKRVFIDENRLERLPNIKDVKGYLERFDMQEQRIKDFWKTS